MAGRPLLTQWAPLALSASSSGGLPACRQAMTINTVNDIYAREVVMARVGHLIRRKQREIERITRILRGCFDPGQVLAPEPGRITRILLIGPYARRSWYEDKHTLQFSDYELWVIVNHPLFTDERCWQRARNIIERELGNRCAVELNILSKADVRAAQAERDHFILDRIEAGITLYRASRDAPLNTREASLRR
ncbi:hypothetical protein [Sphingomonas koreensis]